MGVRSYRFTTGVWTRGILATEYGVDLGAVTWVLATDKHVEEYVAPSNVVASPNNDLGRMLLAGEIDAAIAPGRRRLAPQDRGLSRQPQSHAGLATELFRLFNEARSQFLRRLRSGAAADAGDRPLLKLAETVGDDPLPYSFESSRKTLETFIRFNVDQG